MLFAAMKVDGWLGAAMNLGICSAFQAELSAVWLGLEVAWEHGFRDTVLDDDLQVVYWSRLHTGGGEWVVKSVQVVIARTLER